MLPPEYRGREQTFVKHFILSNYLQELAIKVLQSGFYDHITYVDGFSGPWKAEDEEFHDTSFRRAIKVLKDVQFLVRKNGFSGNIRCVFIEKNRSAYLLLEAAVAAFHKPSDGFEIVTIHGEFDNNVPRLLELSHGGFLLTFIDPTGWTGYEYRKTKPILRRPRSEVLINFMYDHFNRFLNVDDPSLEEQRTDLLGIGWRERVHDLVQAGDLRTRGEILTELYRERLKSVGDFRYAVTTKIEKATMDRPHFFLAYGTRNSTGLETYRGIEMKALRLQESVRRVAKDLKAEDSTKQLGLGLIDETETVSDRLVDDEMENAKTAIVNNLSKFESSPYELLKNAVMERFILSRPLVNKIVAELADQGIIRATWKDRNPRAKVPGSSDQIQSA